MAAASGTITLRRANGSALIISQYHSDAAGVTVKVSRDGKADANSPGDFFADTFYGIEDYCLGSATGQTTTVVKVNDQPAGILLNANHLASVTVRPNPGIIVRPGQKVTFYQVA